MTRRNGQAVSRKKTPAPAATRYRSLDDPETLRLLVRNLGEGIYITTADGEILDANDAFIAIVGYPSLEELRKHRVEELYADPARREDLKSQLGADGQIREFELEIRRLDGQVRTVLDTCYALRDEGTGEVFYHGILVDIDARKELERQLFEASIRDPLTGAYNRRYLEKLERTLDRSPQETWACIYVDLDDFKAYNDTHGHPAGDAALIAVTRFLMRELRSNDSVVRVGGDEFLAILREISPGQTQLVVKRIEESATRSDTVPFSIGSAEREEGEPFARTMERADQRLLSVRSGERVGARRQGDRRT